MTQVFETVRPLDAFDDELDVLVDAGPFSYDEARRMAGAGVTDPLDPDITEDAIARLYAREADEQVSAATIPGEQISIVMRTQQLHRALGALAQISRLSGLEHAAVWEPHASKLADRYHDRIDSLVESASAKRARLAALVRPAFMLASVGEAEPATEDKDTDAVNMWRAFNQRFGGAAGAKARTAYRRQLERVAAKNGFDLLPVEPEN